MASSTATGRGEPPGGGADDLGGGCDLGIRERAHVEQDAALADDGKERRGLEPERLREGGGGGAGGAGRGGGRRGGGRGGAVPGAGRPGAAGGAGRAAAGGAAPPRGAGGGGGERGRGGGTPGGRRARQRGGADGGWPASL